MGMRFGNEITLNIVGRIGMRLGNKATLNTVNRMEFLPATVTVQDFEWSLDSMADLDLFDIWHYQSLCCIHGNTNVVVCSESDGGTLRINSSIQNGIAVESHRDCLDDDRHV